VSPSTTTFNKKVGTRICCSPTSSFLFSLSLFPRRLFLYERSLSPFSSPTFTKRCATLFYPRNLPLQDIDRLLLQSRSVPRIHAKFGSPFSPSPFHAISNHFFLCIYFRGSSREKSTPALIAPVLSLNPPSPSELNQSFRGFCFLKEDEKYKLLKPWLHNRLITHPLLANELSFLSLFPSLDCFTLDPHSPYFLREIDHGMGDF